MAKRKNRAAQELGRKGGKANTLAQMEARRRNAVKGGRPQLYDIQHHGTPTRGTLIVHRRGDDDAWHACQTLSPAMLNQVAKWLRENLRRAQVVSIDSGVISYSRVD